MKLMFVAARSTHDLGAVLKKVNIKEKKIGIVSSVQFLHRLPEVKNKIPGSKIVGQVLGCNFYNVDKAGKMDAYLYIGSAPFHAVGVAWHTRKPVYVANPFTNEFSKLDEKEVEKYEKEKRGKILKFLHARKVGIIVSVKPHQGNYRRALDFQDKLKGKKESYIFFCDNLDLGQFENFPDIECWVNTACPRIEHPKVVNLKDALSVLEK